MNKEIVGLLQQGYSLLTPTMRLSRHLLNQHAALQIEQGKRSWESADILPWQAWLIRFWDDYSASKAEEALLLNSWQQQNVWLQVVQDSDFAEDLLQADSVARQAIQAWALLHQWQMPLYPKDIYISHDVRAFQSWTHAYEQLCQAEQWLDDACLPDVLGHQLSTRSPRHRQKIALVGFEHVLPQQQALLAALSASGSEVKIIALEQRQQHISAAAFVDVRDEIDAAAHWVWQQLQTNKNESIGLVVPNLSNLRTQIQNQFDDVLLADNILESVAPSHRPYSISLGQGLSRYPVISAAFSILALMEKALPIDEMAVLLRSPFIKGAAKEQISRALLDAALREFGEAYISINTLMYIADKRMQARQRSGLFLECLQQWQTEVEHVPATQSTRNWAQTFTTLLGTFNWPGERVLNSDEYQTLHAWQDLLAQFVSLDLVNSTLDFRAALVQLRQLANAFSFQPETAEVPVQIMGPVGAAGLCFDHLWLMGLHEEAWPAASESSPFIPIILQRQYKLPDASAENRLAHARHISNCLLQSSPDVVISYPQNDRERGLRPSPLISSYLHESDQLQIERLPAYNKLVFDSRQFEYYQDELGPGIKSGRHVRGGTGLFKDQAACPFRAFARHRLHAYGLESADIGLDAMERGSLIHEVMQEFWKKTGGHKALMALTDEQLIARINDSIDVAIAFYKKQRAQLFSTRFTLLEKQRLHLLVSEWLDLERQRQPFKVLACEKKHDFVFSEIEVHTRIDRIDELDDGRQIIIDYKTGNVSVNAWFDERPDEPQLPLYAITNESELAAIVFAKIKRGEFAFVGITEGEDILPGLKSFDKTNYVDEFKDWQGMLASWRQNLSRLASDFRQGKADVDPKNVNSCRYCDLHALCRIHEKVEPGSTDIDKIGRCHE